MPGTPATYFNEREHHVTEDRVANHAEFMD